MICYSMLDSVTYRDTEMMVWRKETEEENDWKETKGGMKERNKIREKEMQLGNTNENEK